MAPKAIEVGDKVIYTLPGDEKEKKGVVHGIRKVDTDDGSQRIISYLVDTGEDVRVDRYETDPRGQAIGRHMSKLVAKNPEIMHDQAKLDHALKSAQELKDLPKAGIIVDEVRQPVQIDVPIEHVRPS